MTVYYCNSSSISEEYSASEHIAGIIRSIKPEADAIAYIDCVYNSNEKIYGSHGNYVDKFLDGKSHSSLLLPLERSEIVKQFKDGLIAYKETPLGACTKVGPCKERAVRSFAACTNCDRSIIKISRLNKVIDRQVAFVEELEAISPDSMASRIESDELNILRRYKCKVDNKGG
ncbi:hypothetical protein FT643_20155 [Ketobacter sp. MCCC 1A13808]|uniref:hypothetical protein n=1 Tax=Ketobacter sp. MCCC 1A13808 TaxID=2602738 RepID=UPI0012EB3D37|nr:hypothetical protein [Ketobacter sp. MCCC 1A13808]MVF14454.1 hypothetical protein [Ketobacter sp. MCCC 1A13808]